MNNFYPKSLAYLKKQTTEYFPKLTSELPKYLTPRLYRCKPFFDVVEGKENLEDALKLFALELLEDRAADETEASRKRFFDTLLYISGNFDLHYLTTVKTEALGNMFARSLQKEAFQMSEFFIRLTEAAKYLSKLESYDALIARLSEASMRATLLDDFCDAAGVTKSFARNYFESLGCIFFEKVNAHTMNILGVLQLPNDAETSEESLRELSSQEGVSIYTLDRLIRLICSGKYYLDDKEIEGGKYFLRKKFTEFLEANM